MSLPLQFEQSNSFDVNAEILALSFALNEFLKSAQKICHFSSFVFSLLDFHLVLVSFEFGMSAIFTFCIFKESFCFNANSFSFKASSFSLSSNSFFLLSSCPQEKIREAIAIIKMKFFIN